MEQVAQSEFGVEDYLGAEDWAGMLLLLEWDISRVFPGFLV